ncbi:NADPH-dependent FMN reductase [Streptomyces sp. NPDC007088]|uniref:NADPH-dependent FMN reductase n=1 Tax=Streptomyces sp. NPDC007088 TaxID=3364773 RepID=UPI0036CD030D
MDIAQAPTHTPAPSSGPGPADSAVPAPAPVLSGRDRPLRTTLVVGSNREGRFGPVIADWVLSRMAARPGLVPVTVDVGTTTLPAAITSRPEPEPARELSATSAALAAADAFVVLTPEYNHSYPAPLKNLIDWHFDEWQAKPVGFVSYGGVSGGLRAVEHLRGVFAELHAVTVRETVSFAHAAGLFDPSGRPRDPATAEAALDRLLDQLDWWGHTLREGKDIRPYGS